ncbi:MAG: MFS transporter [Acidobacteriota bacterium]|nr:MFS transporter [Acidobacteriota bacterium]
MAWRLACFYFLLFAYLGVFLPWLPPLLRSRGLDAAGIGLALATVQVSRFLLPPLWGLVADRLNHPRRLLALASLLAGSSLVALAWAVHPAAIFACLALHGFFLVPLFPLAETLTMAALGDRPQGYGRIRLWGSVGFIVASFCLGMGVDLEGLSETSMVSLMGLPLALGAVVALVLPAPRAPGRRSAVESAGLPRAALAVVIVAAGLGQGAHGPYYAFFTLQLQEAGVSGTVTGLLWGWGVAAEVAMMAVSGFLIRRIGLKGAFVLSLLAGSLRWGLYAGGPPLGWLAAGQTLHGISFGLLHVSTIRLVDRLSPPGRKALGQSLVSACSYGAAIGLGSFLAGRGQLALGYRGLFAVAAAASLLGALVALASRAPRRERD